MIMPREKKEILKEDIMPLDVYIKNRKELRKNIVNFKKDRRIALGPYATFYFESYETMLAQVQEMLYIEKGGDEQLKDELVAYNPLIPINLSAKARGFGSVTLFHGKVSNFFAVERLFFSSLKKAPKPCFRCSCLL